MNMETISNTLLEIFYCLVGMMMILSALLTFNDKEHEKRIGTTLFWTTLGLIFIFGSILPDIVMGAMLLLIGYLSLFKQVRTGKLNLPDPKFSLAEAQKLGNKVFYPPLIIALLALVIAQFTDIVGTAAIGIASLVALLATFLITKAEFKYAIKDSNRMLKSVGPTAILPQLLAALGALFTAAGVGDVISNIISNVIPEGNILFGVIAYCVGMALFTMIMGNAFAAFSVITVGIGIPFVFAQGANIAIAGLLGLTAGYCGTLMTPMAANFNIMPAVLLETKNQNTVIKYQAPFAITLLILHIVLMYFFAF